MTRGTKLLSNSKCKCGTYGKTDNPYGHVTGSGALYLKGHCHRCNKIKSLPYTHQQLQMEGEGVKKFFKNVWDKSLKPAGSHFGKNILKNPGRVLQVASQIGMAGSTRDPLAIRNAGVATGKFAATGKGVKIGELTTRGALWLAPR